MSLDIVHIAKHRHTAKAYDPSRRISDADMERVRELLRYSPSSTNLQPWHFVIAGSDQGKARVAKAAQERFPFNLAAIREASHVIVFASRVGADEAYLEKVLTQEDADGRFAADPAAMKERQHKGRSYFVGLHVNDLNDGPQWMARQLYINLGQFLLGVATLGINATPMEGIDTQVLDTEFDLPAKGLASQFIVPIGYADPARDYNASLPKSRLSQADIITQI